MASPTGTTPDALGGADYLQELEQLPHGRHLFQVLRRLENIYRDQPRIGRAARTSADPVRLRQEPSLAFAPSMIHSFRRQGSKGPAELSVFSFGLFGPNGPLPLHLTEYARERMRKGDSAFRDFADIFHHRLLGLFYRAWANAQPEVQADRPEDDRFAFYLGTLAGLALEVSEQNPLLPDSVRLHYTGQLGCPTRHPDGLRSIIAEYFDVPVAIEEFVGHWVQLPEACRCRLGESPRTGQLGRTLTMGASIWQCQDKFRIVIGPLAEHDYLRLLPPSESVERLRELVRSYVGDEFVWDVRLILNRADVRPLVLGERSQLGFNSWLISGKLEKDPREYLMDPSAKTVSRAGERAG